MWAKSRLEKRGRTTNAEAEDPGRFDIPTKNPVASGDRLAAVIISPK
jgi:hypothetical protein